MTNLRREAIIYLPGLDAYTGERDTRSIPTEVAARLAKALDQRAGRRDALFQLSSRNLIGYGHDLQSAMQRIERTDDESVTAIVDVYGLDYLAECRRRHVNRTVYRRLCALLFLFVTNITLPFRIFRSGASWLKVWQFLCLNLVLGIIGVSVIVTALSAILWVTEWVTAANPEAYCGTSSGLAHYCRAVAAHTIGSAAAVAVPAVSLLGLMTALPERHKLYMGNVVTNVLCTLEYVVADEGRSLCTEHVPALLEALENQKRTYDAIHVLAYSFGSVVALDTLFPQGESAPPACAKIESLTTIGCPFDLVESLWPEHYQNRAKLPGGNLRWYNVTIHDDPMGTGEHNEPNVGDTRVTERIEGRLWGMTASVGVVGQLLLRGMPLHTRYWDRETVDSRSCYDPLVSRLFKDGGVLA